MINKPGYSFGPNHPIHFIHFGLGSHTWRVFDARDDRTLAEGLTEWEASKLAAQENEAIGFGCKPDLSAIDSTP